MKKIYLSIVAGMAISAATAQQTSLANNTAPGGGYDAAPALSMDTYPTEAAAEAADAAPALRYYSGDGRRSTLFGGLEAGVISATYKNDTGTRSSSAATWKVELGWRRLMPTRYADRYNFFALSVAYSDFTIKESYRADDMNLKAGNYFAVIQIPVSYSSINNKNSVGFYWQIGTNLNYNYQIKSEKATLIHSFSRVWVEPNLSLGMSIRYEKRGLDMCALIGPYVGYSVTNIAKNDGESTRFLNIGIKYTSIIF
jgi:hypothetical protein